MNKRSFLQGLLAALGAGAAAGVSAQPRRRTLIQVSPLAGFQITRAVHSGCKLAGGQPLTLVRGRDNTFDAGAARIDWHGHKLGYLPRAQNTAVAQMVERGERLSVRIAQLRKSPDPSQRMMVAVELLV